MKRVNLIALTIAVCVCLSSLPAHAQLIYGTTSDAATFLCLPACTNGNFNSDGGENTVSSSATQDDSRGLGFSSASLGGPLSLPILKAKGIGDDSPQSGAASGSAFALQGYTYTGTEAKEYTLNISFSGQIISAAETFADSIIARVGIFETDVMEFESSLPTLLETGAVFWQDLDSNDALAEFSLFNSTGGLTTLMQSIEFELFPGDKIYLYTTLSASAFSVPDSGGTSGALADASQSLTMSFIDGTDLVAEATASAVPIPPALWLFGSGLLGMIGIAKRKRSA